MIIFSRVAFLALGFVVPAVLISSAATAEDHVKCRVGTRKNKTITPKDYTAKYFDFRYEPAAELSGHFHKNNAGYFVLDDTAGGGSISPTDAQESPHFSRDSYWPIFIANDGIGQSRLSEARP